MQVLFLSCPLCGREVPEVPAEGPPPGDKTIEERTASMRGVRLTTEIAQHLHCSKGHEFLLHVQDSGYGLLYERALQRLADGRTRDAVLDAYTVFDMFLGSAVLGAAFVKRYPDHTTPLDGTELETLRADLKDVLKSSERTIGAALALACVTSGQNPPKIPTELNEIRNKAIHVGVYPSDEDAEWACLEVEKLVNTLRQQLEPTTDGGQSNTRFRFALMLESRRRAIGDRRDILTSTWSVMSVLEPFGPPGVRNAASRIAEYRDGGRLRFID
jgi:hypothetical protein